MWNPKDRHTFQHDGILFTAAISPCCFSQPESYPLQVQISAPEVGAIFAVDRNVLGSKATQEQFLALCKVHLIPCNKCGAPAYDPTKHNTNRKGQCESCFVAALEASVNLELEQIAAEERLEDQKYKAQGFTHRINLWIHPAVGSDYEVAAYTRKEPTTVEIQKMLQKRKSRELNDYKVTAL